MDLLEEMGASLPIPGTPVGCGQKAPKAPPKRHTNWSNESSFTFEGWLARIHRCHCKSCEQKSEWLEGVFLVERSKSGARRLTRATDWPAQGAHSVEVIETQSLYCALCIRELGFSLERVAERSYTLILGAGTVQREEELAKPTF